jgi:hypothetical protein
MGTQKVIADSGFNCLELPDFSASSPERRATDAVVLKKKMLPGLYKQQLIISTSYVVILSHGDIQAADDMEQAHEVVPEVGCCKTYELQSLFSYWEKTVSRILGREIGTGTFVNKVV